MELLIALVSWVQSLPRHSAFRPGAGPDAGVFPAARMAAAGRLWFAAGDTPAGPDTLALGLAAMSSRVTRNAVAAGSSNLSLPIPAIATSPLANMPPMPRT